MSCEVCGKEGHTAHSHAAVHSIEGFVWEQVQLHHPDDPMDDMEHTTDEYQSCPGCVELVQMMWVCFEAIGIYPDEIAAAVMDSMMDGGKDK